MTMFAFAPLSRTLTNWPKDLFGEPGGVLDDVGVTDFAVVTDHDTDLEFKGTVAWLREIELKLPSLDAVSIAFLSKSGFTQIDFELRVAPSFELTLKNLNAAIRLRVGFLKPVKKDSAGNWVVQLDANGEPVPAEIEFAGADLKVATDGNIELVFPSGAPTLSIPPLDIGGSGIVLEMNEIELYLSEKQDPPPGAKPGFKGVAVKHADLHLSGGLGVAAAPTTITFNDLIIGSSGFSGEIHALWSGNGQGSFFGLDFKLKSLDFTFVQNVPTDASLKGTIKLPFFDHDVDVEISVGVDGGLSVALDATGGLYTFTKPGLLEMTLDSMEFDLDGGVFAAKLAGKIKPLVGGLQWPAFDIQELKIDSTGKVEFSGGWIDLPKGYTLNLAAFKLEITKFGMGHTDQGEKFIGFSGGLNLVKGFPAGVSVEGLRILWIDPAHPRLTFNGIGIEFSVPGVLDFKGAISYYDSGASLKKFTGALKLNLPKLKFKLDGVVVFGSDVDADGKRFKYFALFVEGEFGTGIPIFNTGLSITGIAGLFSINYAPDKPEEWLWYSMDAAVSWFHKPQKGVTDLVHKWAPKDDAKGFGAGIMVATSSDQGYMFHSKFLLLFLFPGVVVMLDGRGDILKRAGKQKDGEEPMFHSLLVLDFKAGYFLVGLDARWKYPADSGKLVDIAGSAEGYFNFLDPRQWHFYVGKKPLDQRIRAKFASSFEANSYFMLDPHSLALGVWIGKSEHYHFGPVSADLEAWLDANAVLSFRPAQLTAGIEIHGLFAVRVFKFKFGIGIDARLSAEVAKPFHILGTLSITIETPLKDFDIEVRLEWGPRPERPPLADPFRDAGIAHLKSTNEWLLLDNTTLLNMPMDCRPYLTFEMPVHDASGVALNPSPDPGWIRIGDPSANQGPALVRYDLEEVALEKFDGSTWTKLPKLYGSWAADPTPNQTRLMLYAKTPFDLTDASTTWNPWLADNLRNYPCPIVRDETVCIFADSIFDQSQVIASPWKDSGIEVSWNGGPRPVKLGLPGGFFKTRAGIVFATPEPARDWGVYAGIFSSGRVAVIDSSTDKQTASFTAGASAIAFTPDGTRILVASLEMLTVFDAATLKPIGKPMQIGESTEEIAVFPGGKRAWTTAAGDNVLCVIDVAAPAVVQKIKIQGASEGIAILPNGSKIYVADANSSTILVLDPKGNLIGKPITGTHNGRYIAAAPNGQRLYVGSTGDNALRILDTSTDQFLPDAIVLGAQPWRLCITPDGSRVFVILSGGSTAGGTVAAIDTAKNAVIARIPVGSRPLGIAVTPDGKKVYAGNFGSKTLSVIDVATLQVVGAPIPVGDVVAVAISPVSLSGAAPAGDPPIVEIEVPAGSSAVDVFVSGEPVGEVIDPANGFGVIKSDGIKLHFDAATMKLHDGIHKIRVRGTATWYLAGVCYTRPVLDGGLADLNQLHDQLQQGVSVWGEPAAVLEPFTDYRLRAVVKRSVAGTGELSGWNETTPFTLQRAFKTSGPPGLAAQSLTDIGLGDLTRYVEQTVPPTLTPPNARPELTRPVFRAYDRGARMNENYVDRMYELAERDLAIQIYDGSNEPARGVDGRLAVMANQWGNAAEVQLTETHKLWIDVLNAATCLPGHIKLDDVARNKTLAAADHVLKANTLHEARLVPLLLRAPHPGGSGWSPDTLFSAIPMLKRNNASTWSDLLMRLEIQPHANGLTGVAFRLNAQGCYVLTIDVAAGRRTLVLLNGSAHHKIADDAFAFDANQSYRFSIEAIGSRLRVEQDDLAVFELDDATHAQGTIGLFPWTGGPPHHFDVAVHDFSKGAPVAYRFPFTTSQYADFFHQIHSYQDKTWPGILPDAIDLATAAVRAIDLTVAAPEPESRVFDLIAEKILGSAAHQLPKRLEVTRVEQGGDLKALLVRGDEPIDWRRTTLDVWHSSGNATSLAEPATMKIASAWFGFTMLSGDAIEVLLRDEFDPTGSRIEARLPAAPLRESTAPPLLIDRFAGNDLAGWTLVDELPNVATAASSSWKTQDGSLVLSNTITDGGDPAFLGTFAAAGDAVWTDVAFSARVRSPQGGAAGFAFRGQGIDDYYRFSMDSNAGYRQLVKKTAGAFTILWRDDVAYDPQREYAFIFTAIGTSLRGYIDGVPLFAVDDAAHADGIIACYTAMNEAVFSGVRVDDASHAASAWLLDERFSDAEAWAFDPPAPWVVANDAMAAPALNAGDAATAVAGDPAWTDYRLTVNLDPGTTGSAEIVFRHQVGPDRFYALRFDSGASAVGLLKSVGGQETSLWTDAWTPHPMLVTIDCIGSSITGFENGRLLLHQVDEELTSGRAGVRVRGTTGATIGEVRVAAPEWTPWYTFENERKREAGTKLLVYGTEFDIGLPPVEPGTIRKLLAHGARIVRLPIDGFDLRVVDGDGTVHHARHFLPFEAWTPIDVDLMRNADGTGFFVLPRSTPSLARGTYRLTLTFERNKAGVTPILSRAGSEAAERVDLDIVVAK